MVEDSSLLITFPDGNSRNFDRPVTGLVIAESISKSLAKKALAVRVNGELWDLKREIPDNARIEIVTRDDPDALELLRHDAAHIMAEAVKELYPETQVTIGPAIENGFYYDFARPTSFTPEDLVRIEERMHDIVRRNESIDREVWDRQQAVEWFRGQGEIYKAEIIESIPGEEPITVYRQGDFADLCRGPHLPSTSHLGKGFKLTKLAGAYWRGDSNNEMLQRIYGTCWANEKDLKAYLRQLEEAEKRDHRRLGREMDLFHFQEEAPGGVFWHPKGWTLFQELINYMRQRQDDAGYLEISTPELLDRSLWERSGHWEKFGENMFTSVTPDERDFALKPMNCPGCVQVFNHGIKSYRDLPLKMAEFGKVHRYEPSGALHGLMRVRAFTQDDAHIFCTDKQITEECVIVTNLILDIYRDFGFDQVRIKFSDRPEVRVGDDAIWDVAEAALREAVAATGLDYELNPGEGAFYGPKLEFVLRDAIGRDWQCGTLQVDLNLPERLGAEYVASSGEKVIPVMLHRALFGSLERFAGILIENYAGNLPLWLAPVQVVIATITSASNDYAKVVARRLEAAGLRVDMDLRNEKISYKVREHSHAKIPVIMAVGEREAESDSVAVRRLGSKAQTVLTVAQAIDQLTTETGNKSLPLGHETTSAAA